jgi:hypothetical protein
MSFVMFASLVFKKKQTKSKITLIPYKISTTVLDFYIKIIKISFHSKIFIQPHSLSILQKIIISFSINSTINNNIKLNIIKKYTHYFIYYKINRKLLY